MITMVVLWGGGGQRLFKLPHRDEGEWQWLVCENILCTSSQRLEKSEFSKETLSTESPNSDFHCLISFLPGLRRCCFFPPKAASSSSSSSTTTVSLSLMMNAKSEPGKSLDQDNHPVHARRWTTDDDLRVTQQQQQAQKWCQTLRNGCGETISFH